MGTYLSTPKTDKHSADGEGARVRYGLASMQGWRTTMEDAHTAVPQLDECTSFFAVYDGHGGKAVAKFCAKHLHMQFLRNEAYSSGDLASSVRKAFLRMDEMMKGQRGWRELAELGEKGPKFAGMLESIIWSPKGGDADKLGDGWHTEEGPHSDFSGPTCGSTACVAIIRNDQLVVANAGDSRCVISRKGQAHDLSRDHKPELESEKERIKNAGGYIVAGRVNGSLNLTRAIGDMEMKENKLLPAEKQTVSAEPEVNTVTLSEDDEFIVLACDGIWDCMSSQQVVDFVHEKLNTEDSLSAVCEKVLDRCLAPESGGEGCDNMTMILVVLKKPTNSAATSSSEQSAVTPTKSAATSSLEQSAVMPTKSAATSSSEQSAVTPTKSAATSSSEQSAVTPTKSAATSSSEQSAVMPTKSAATSSSEQSAVTNEEMRPNELDAPMTPSSK